MIGVIATAPCPPQTAAVSAGAAFIAAAAHAGHPDMATPGAPHKLLEMVAGALRDDLTPAETRDALLDAAGGLGEPRMVWWSRGVVRWGARVLGGV